MKATVVIPNLNGAGWLRDSIESVWAQTEQDFELIVVDNGSADESLAIARSYVGRANYTLIENAENTGFSYAVNQGIRAAKGEFVALFNNDAFAEPDWLENLLAAAEKDGRICYQKPGRVFSACGGAALYRKSILDKIGLFDEHFFAYFEDVDISWRANSLGYKNVYCPTARCYHICGATTGAVRYNPFKSVQSGRNSILLPYKNMPILMFLLNLPFLALGYLMKAVMFRLRGYGPAYFQGFKEALKVMGKLDKPKFRFKNLPNYVLIQLWLAVDTVRYFIYRAQRALHIT